MEGTKASLQDPRINSQILITSTFYSDSRHTICSLLRVNAMK